jgi:lipoate-protein ligase B
LTNHAKPEVAEDETLTAVNASQWWYTELGLCDYTEALDLQRDLVAARHSGHLPANVVLLLEHPSVFTLGRRGGMDNLTVPREKLARAGIDIVAVERGGDITYHGPGQLVGYPLVALKAAGLGVVDFVTALEEVMIRTAADWGVEARRDSTNRGIWVGSRKLGSLGLSVRRGISFHGFALNVINALEPFGWINPCGLSGVAMTSLQNASQKRIQMVEIVRQVRGHLEAVFGIHLKSIDRFVLETYRHRSADGSQGQ